MSQDIILRFLQELDWKYLMFSLKSRLVTYTGELWYDLDPTLCFKSIEYIYWCLGQEMQSKGKENTCTKCYFSNKCTSQDQVRWIFEVYILQINTVHIFLLYFLLFILLMFIIFCCCSQLREALSRNYKITMIQYGSMFKELQYLS